MRTNGPLSTTDRWLLVAASVCVAVAAFEILVPHPIETPAAPPETAPDTAAPPSPAENALPGPDHYTGITERPLFTLDRRPYQPPVEAPREAPIRREEPPPPRIEFELNAVVSTPRANIALLKSSASPEVVRLTVGQSIQGWTLIEVRSSAVVLTKGSETITVTLELERPPGESPDDPTNQRSTTADETTRQAQRI